MRPDRRWELRTRARRGVARLAPLPSRGAAGIRAAAAVEVRDRELRGGGLAATAAITWPARAPKVLVGGGRGSPAELRAVRLAGGAACLPGDIDAAGLTAAIAALIRKEQS